MANVFEFNAIMAVYKQILPKKELWCTICLNNSNRDEYAIGDEFDVDYVKGLPKEEGVYLTKVRLEINHDEDSCDEVHTVIKMITDLKL